MGWLIALAVMTAAALLPLGVQGIYSEKGAFLSLIVGPLRLALYPGKGKKAGKKEDTQQPAQEGQAGTKGGAATDFMPLVRAVLDFLADLKSKLRVNVLQVYVTLAGDDPCDLAINYGKAWAAVGNIMPHLERIFVIKNRDVQVSCDFTGDQTRIYARVDVTVTVARILSLGLRYGTKVIREYLKIVKIKKGGALQ